MSHVIKKEEGESSAQPTKTQQRNQRKIASRKLKYLKETGMLPQDATIDDMQRYYKDEGVEKPDGDGQKQEVKAEEGKEDEVTAEQKKGKGKGRKIEDYDV